MSFSRIITLCSFFLSVFSVSAENLIFNSSFELDDAGFGFRRYLRSETNPLMRYEGILADKSTFVSGRQSLKIPNSFSEQCELFAKEIKLEADTEYSVSVFMRSSDDSYPVRIRILSFSTVISKWGYDFKKDISVGRGWNEYKFSFKTPGTEKACEYFTIFIESCRSPETKGADLWIDDFQLNKGKIQNWQASNQIEASMNTGKRIFVMQDGNEIKVPLETSIINNSKNDVALNLKINLKSEKDDSIQFSRNLNISLNPGEKKNLDLEVPINKYGTYYSSVELEADTKAEIASVPAVFSVIGEYKAKEIDTDKTFCVSLNTGLGECFPPRYGQIEKAGFPASGLSQEEYVQMLSIMGCRLIRDWDGDAGVAFKWCDIEPKEGLMNFKNADRVLTLCDKYKIELMPIIGTWLGHSNPNINPLPQWLRPKCEKRTVTPYNNRKETDPLFPPEDAWRKHVRAIAEKYKGRIRHYEIINEPNADYFANEYMILLKAAHEEMKKADSQVAIIGFCSSGDWGLPPGAFLEDCAKTGGLKYSDIVSYHPYETPKIPAANKLNQACMDIIKKYNDGKMMPLWNTEIYYLTGKGKNDDEKGRYKPADAAQRFLTDLGDGLGQSIAVTSSSLWQRVLSPHLSSNYGREWIPSDKYVCYNALARIFEGAKPKNRIFWPAQSVCYIYEREGRALAAFWAYGDKKDLSVKIDANSSDIELFDVLGNRIPFPENGLIKLSNDPVYVVAKKKSILNILSNELSPDELDSIMKKAVIENERPVEIGVLARPIPTDNGKWMLSTTLHNDSANEITGVLEIDSVSREITVPAGKEIYALTEWKTGGLTKTLAKFSANGKSWTAPLEICPETKVLISGQETAIGQNAKLKAEYRLDKLLLTFTVKDASPSGDPSGRAAWEQDCIEIFLDTAPEKNSLKTPALYTENVTRLFVLPYAAKNLIVDSKDQKLKATQCKVFRQNDGYAVELEIPLDPSKNLIGFDVQIDDADTKAVKSKVFWSSQGNAYKNRLEFGFIIRK